MKYIEKIKKTFKKLNPWNYCVPTIIQMEATECGAACLAMICAYYKKYVPLEEMRVACGVSRDGSRLQNIIKAADRYGFFSIMKSVQELDRLKDIPLPAILHWNMSHFVVLEKIKGNKYYLNDPAYGHRVVTREEMDLYFTGVVLILTPDFGFEPGGQKPSIIPSLRRFVQEKSSPWIFLLLCGILLVITGLIMPSFTSFFVDNIIVAKGDNLLYLVIFGMLIVSAIQTVLTWIRDTCLMYWNIQLTLSNANSFFWHIIRLPMTFFEHRYAGEVGSRVLLNQEVSNIICNKLANALLNIFMLIFYILIMIQYSQLLTLILVCMAFINFIYLGYVARYRSDLQQRLLAERGALQTCSMIGINSIETIKAAGSESEFWEKWMGYQAKVMNSEKKFDFSTQFLNACPTLVTSLATLAVLIFGSMEVMEGKMTVGSLMAFQAITISFLSPINTLVSLGGTLQETGGTLLRLEDTLKYQLDPLLEGKKDIDLNKTEQLKGEIEFKNIGFSYGPLEPLFIKDLSLKIQPGMHVAIVGASGSGKSTMARLLTGLYQPVKGEILFDGSPPESFSRNTFCSSISIVSQNVTLFSGTVAENISMFDNTISRSDIVMSALDACIHEDICRLPGGYNAPVEEGGRNFSGGQRQRIEIAKALAVNPSIIILDEATSALDTLIEEQVIDNIKARKCTVILIAHRLSTIRDCDKIIVLEKGKIVEEGTHSELMALEGIYKKLIESE